MSANYSCSESVDEIKLIVCKLCEHESPNNEQWLVQLDEGTELMSNLFSENIGGIDKTLAFSLESAGVYLWNYTVVLKTKCCVTATTNAKMRHLSFLMVSFPNRNVNDEDTLKKQIIMGMKSGKAWIDAQKPDNAEFVLNISNQCVQRLHTIVIERKNATTGGTDSIDRQKTEVERDMFKLLCCQAEVAVSQLKNDVAVSKVHVAKQMLPLFPNEGGFLSMLCYNFGVDSYQRRNYEEAIGWLRDCFELGKDRRAVLPKNQARTLRLLANAYIESDPSKHLDQALNAVSLANTENSHPAGLYLKLRILLLGREKGVALATVLDDIVNHPDCTLELGLSVIHLLKQYNGFDTSFDFPSRLMTRFEQSPNSGKILISQLQALLQCEKMQQAKEFSEECITAHNTGTPLDIKTKKQFHLVFWEQAATAFECKQFVEAVTWYNYSMSLFSPSETSSVNMAKLQRNRASCFISLGQNSQAKEAIQQAERCEPDEAHTQFIIYKIALAENDTVAASTSLEKLVKGTAGEQNICQSQSFGLICLAAQFALERHCCEPACLALDFLVQHSSDHRQVLTALRCLVRLRLAQADSNSYDSNSLGLIIPLIRTAYNKMLILAEVQTESNTQTQFQEEATWFMKIAWNLALKCEDEPVALKDFFSQCLKILSLLPKDSWTRNRQKTCTLMAAAGCLQMARVCADPQKTEALEEALQCIGEYKSLRSAAWVESEGHDGHNTTDVLLVLYEFEARVKLKDSGAEAVLERALTLPQPEAKTFEALAALAVDPPACEQKLSIRSLKVAIRTHLQKETPDFQRCSNDIHNLIQLSMNMSQTISKQDTYSYFREAIDVIDKKAKRLYPEMEILWLMTKAWNGGIHFYSSGDFDEAERWCSMSMGLLKHLTTMKSNYEDQMNPVYGEILTRIEHARGKSSLEE